MTEARRKWELDGASHSLINQGVEDLEFLAFIIPE